jgi:hypothetical protein
VGAGESAQSSRIRFISPTHLLLKHGLGRLDPLKFRENRREESGLLVSRVVGSGVLATHGYWGVESGVEAVGSGHEW